MYAGTSSTGEVSGVSCHLTVDRTADGWAGHVGVVGAFSSARRPVPVDDTVAFVCGPPVMFRFVIQDL